jgi:hypothetical protein
MANDPIANLLDTLDKYIEAKHRELSCTAELKDDRVKIAKISKTNFEMALRYILTTYVNGFRIDIDPDEDDQ